MKDMDHIRNKSWETDREFQDAIASALGKVHDAHLVKYIYIYINDCYFFMQLLILKKVLYTILL
jgi:hypothetical protein